MLKTIKPCTRCPYKLGLVKTLVNPCLQCKLNGYKTFEEMNKRVDGTENLDEKSNK